MWRHRIWLESKKLHPFLSGSLFILQSFISNLHFIKEMKKRTSRIGARLLNYRNFSFYRSKQCGCWVVANANHAQIAQAEIKSPMLFTVQNANGFRNKYPMVNEPIFLFWTHNNSINSFSTGPFTALREEQASRVTCQHNEDRFSTSESGFPTAPVRPYY